MPEISHVKRNFGPVYDADSKILILGSFPSVKSREQSFYYAHPQNRFWPLLARLYGEDVPGDVQSRKLFALKHNIALWDVVEECDIALSSDSTIRNVVPVDIGTILSSCAVRQIYCNGSASYNLFVKYLRDICGRDAVKLPSTSPANAAFSMDALADNWKIILNN